MSGGAKKGPNRGHVISFHAAKRAFSTLKLAPPCGVFRQIMRGGAQCLKLALLAHWTGKCQQNAFLGGWRRNWKGFAPKRSINTSFFGFRGCWFVGPPKHSACSSTQKKVCLDCDVVLSTSSGSNRETPGSAW